MGSVTCGVIVARVACVECVGEPAQTNKKEERKQRGKKYVQATNMDPGIIKAHKETKVIPLEGVHTNLWAELSITSILNTGLQNCEMGL